MNIDGIHKFYESFKSKFKNQHRSMSTPQELYGHQCGQLLQPHQNVHCQIPELRKGEVVYDEQQG
jgi:hypothetical protein